MAPGSPTAELGHAGASAPNRCRYPWDDDPAGHRCATAPDPAGLMRPPRGSALDPGRPETKGLARGCPRAEPAANGDRCSQRDRDD